MGSVISDMTMSLDGYIAGPNVSIELPLGIGGEQLHTWMYRLTSWREAQGIGGGTTNPDSEVIEEASGRVGAFVMGRRMYDTGEGPWGDIPPFRRPVFVVTHRPRQTLAMEGGTTFTFVTDGVESAVAQARAAAGRRDVGISGGASIIQQAIAAGLLDELQVHVSPLLLGDGTRLFERLAGGPIELTTTRVIDSPHVTHLRFQIGAARAAGA
jgi:dihydrofolate reductase